MEQFAPDKAHADDADGRAEGYPERAQNAAFIAGANVAPRHIEDEARHRKGAGNVGKSGEHS